MYRKPFQEIFGLLLIHLCAQLLAWIPMDNWFTQNPTCSPLITPISLEKSATFSPLMSSFTSISQILFSSPFFYSYFYIHLIFFSLLIISYQTLYQNNSFLRSRCYSILIMPHFVFSFLFFPFYPLFSFCSSFYWLFSFSVSIFFIFSLIANFTIKLKSITMIKTAKYLTLVLASCLVSTMNFFFPFSISTRMFSSKISWLDVGSCVQTPRFSCWESKT